MTSPELDEVVDAMLPRKASKLQVIKNRTPNQHRWSGWEFQGAWENSGEGTRQNNTVTSGEGVPLMVKHLLRKLLGVAETRWLQLFTKNIALCKIERWRIRCDACPVPEG